MSSSSVCVVSPAEAQQTQLHAHKPHIMSPRHNFTCSSSSFMFLPSKARGLFRSFSRTSLKQEQRVL